MARSLSENDIYDLVATKSDCASRTSKRVINNLILLIVNELKSNERITINGLGTFKLEHKGGQDEWYINSMGLKDKKYVKSYEFANFTPSEKFVSMINTDKVKYARFSKSDADIEELEYIQKLQEDDPTPSILEVVNGLLEEKKAKFNTSRENGYHFGKLKCVTNGKTYDSPNQACDELGLSKNKMYVRVRKNVDKFVIDDYEFTWEKDGDGNDK
jgi:nucleoid DNA-binding protein